MRLNEINEMQTLLKALADILAPIPDMISGKEKDVRSARSRIEQLLHVYERMKHQPAPIPAQPAITQAPVSRITPQAEAQEVSRAETNIHDEEAQVIASDAETQAAIKDIYDGMLEQHHLIEKLDKISKQSTIQPDEAKPYASKLIAVLNKMKTIAAKEQPKIMKRYDIHKKNLNDLTKLKEVINISILGDDSRRINSAMEDYAKLIEKHWRSLFEASTKFNHLKDEVIEEQIKHAMMIRSDNLTVVLKEIVKTYKLEQTALMQIEEFTNEAKKLNPTVAAKNMKKLVEELPAMISKARKVFLANHPFVWYDENGRHITSIPDLVGLRFYIEHCNQGLFERYAEFHSFSQWINSVDNQFAKKIHESETKLNRAKLLDELKNYIKS